MLETGPASGWRPASIGSISSRYQRTPVTVRSTEVSAWRQGLPISQTSSRASSSRWRLELVHAAGDAGPPLVQVDLGPLLVLGVRGGHGLQALAELQHRRTGDRAAVDRAGRLGRVAGRCQSPFHRLRTRS